MPGQVIGMLVELGQTVHGGDPVVVLEAMKMEHTLRAPRDGTIAAVHVRIGDQTQLGAVLLEIRADPPAQESERTAMRDALSQNPPA